MIFNIFLTEIDIILVSVFLLFIYKDKKQKYKVMNMENKPKFKDLLSKRNDNMKFKELMNNMIEKSKQQSEKKQISRLGREELMKKLKNHKSNFIKKLALTYEQKVSYLIREKYSQDAEFAILRQRDTKPEEFEVYNNYCEECKNKVKNGEF